MRELLEQIDWESTLCPLDIHTAWQLFSTKFTAILNTWIPFGTPIPKKNLFMTHRALRLKIRNVNYGINLDQLTPPQIINHIAKLGMSFKN